MAKVKDLKKGLGGLKKMPVIEDTASEEIVKAVHPETQIEESPKRGRRKTNVEPTVRYTIDIPESTYKAIRHKVAEEGGTMKSFIMKTLAGELNVK